MGKGTESLVAISALLSEISREEYMEDSELCRMLLLGAGYFIAGCFYF